MLEYILIGEADLGICGHPWRTWGYKSGRGSSDESGDSSSGRSGDDDEADPDPVLRKVSVKGDSDRRGRSDGAAESSPKR